MAQAGTARKSWLAVALVAMSPGLPAAGAGLAQLSQTFTIFAVAAALAWSRRAIFSAKGCSADLPH